MSYPEALIITGDPSLVELVQGVTKSLATLQPVQNQEAPYAVSP
jgi:hypothetical protein